MIAAASSGVMRGSAVSMSSVAVFRFNFDDSSTRLKNGSAGVPWWSPRPISQNRASPTSAASRW